MNVKSYLMSLVSRQGHLDDKLIQLKSSLEEVYEKNSHEAGLIDRGYYTSFNSILNIWRSSGLFERFMLSEEEFVENGNLVKIPVVDLFSNGESKRIFVISKFLKSKYGLN